MNKLRKLAVWMVVLAFAVSTTACGGSTKTKAEAPKSTAQAEKTASGTVKTPEPAKPAEKVTVDFGMIAFANEMPGWTAMIDTANKKLAEKNIEIKVQKVPANGWPEYYQKMITQMAAGNAPDIGRIAESFMPQLITKNQAVDLTNYVKQLDMSKYFESTFKSAAYKNGKYYGVPSGVYYMLMYYNKDLFDKAGLKYPSADWNNAMTFDQVKEAAKKLTSGEGANKTFGFSAGPYMAFIGMYSLSNGGKNVFNDDGTCAIADANSKGVYKWFDDMLRVDKSMPRPTDTKVMDATNMFKSGRIAMMVEGAWNQQQMKDIKNFKVGIAAVPAGKGKAYSSQFVDSFVMFKGTKHEKEAWEALKAMISKEGFDTLAPTGTGGLPIQRETMEALKDKMIGDTFSAEDKKAFISGLDHTVSVPYNEFYQEADQKVNASMDEWLLGKITSDQFADKVNDIVAKAAAAAKK